MDIFSKIFWQGGLALSVILLFVAISALMNAENGQLTVANLEHLGGTYTALFETLKFVVYPWIALGLFLLGRFILRMVKS
ncbi:hypothetical protein THMIRHAS_21770 [Thiosulfatimonas sediminis]|uniref:Uncharacterized protein n=1 Tax=Thiosulfatimonas sediminis TaxID=2675054 RepID=A0A6F8PXT0_9GAMM|nr:hypothetical protein [Thiosulfatimonas sediminis]BBP46804.1 hypothetical protein THMIRHAS_21770 [Thiosulfatimonas sediminis]